MKSLPLPERRFRVGLLAALAMGLCLAIPTVSASDKSTTKTPQAKPAKVKVEKPKKLEAQKAFITSDQIRRMGATSVPFVLSRQTGFR